MSNPRHSLREVIKICPINEHRGKMAMIVCDVTISTPVNHEETSFSPNALLCFSGIKPPFEPLHLNSLVAHSGEKEIE